MLIAGIAFADSSITPQCDADDWEAAAARVRAIAARAFDGYAEHAWGQDELRPVSNRSRDNWGGLAVTMVDSLDTLLLMGLTEHYKRARDWLVDNLPARLGTAVDVPFFEVVIRCLGGLLGAHTLSGDAALLDLAEQLGDRLLRAFVSPSGLPFCTVNLAHGNASCPRSDFGYSIPLAELYSLVEARLNEAIAQIPSFVQDLKAFRAMIARVSDACAGLEHKQCLWNDNGCAQACINRVAEGGRRLTFV